jgi:hypothetical protein
MSSVRKISPYSTNQGNEGTCVAHSIARLISRLIKSLGLEPGDDYPDEFHDTIMFEEGEILDEYYDTINCSSHHTIFYCIALTQDIHERKGKPFSIHKSLNKVINWESENLSAMLFHFIFNSIKNKYGCNGLKFLTERRLESAPIFYFLKLIRKGITEDKIKDILKYDDYVTLWREFFNELLLSVSEAVSKAAEEDHIEAVQALLVRRLKIIVNNIQFEQDIVMFSRLITKLASVFEFFRISLKKKTLKVNIFMSTNLNDFIQINDKLGFRDHGWLVDIKNRDKKNSITHKGYTTITTISSKHTDWFEKIIKVINHGLYVLLTIYGHAILITAIEGDFFIVKNSWGTSRNWTLPNGEQFIVDNKLSISTLVDHATRDERPHDVQLIFIELGERDNYEIFTEDKLPKKSIIHTLKKTAKRLSACFGMGKKNKTQNKFKKYHKKLSKNDKTIKKCSKNN